MAGVSTRISVVDAMTPVMENMYRGVSQLISGLNKLNEASENAIDTSPFLEAQKSMAEALIIQRKLSEGYSDTADEIKKIGTYTEQADSIQRQYNNTLSNGVQRATAFGDNLTNSIKRYIAIAASAYSGKEFINASDSWINNSARLGLITDNMQEQNRLQMQIYNSAKDTRGAYSDMVDVTAKLGLLAGDAFGSNAELVKFTELMQKSFKLSGAGTQERQSAMYQLTQAMASGKLQGDEFRSIMENAPMLANAIAEYTGVSKGELKELSSDGVITADIIKNALFMAADDIESKFETMPMTFGDAWNNVVSDATMAFAPVYEMFNGALNSEFGTEVLEGIRNNVVWLSEQMEEAGKWIGDLAMQAAPALSQISNTIQGIISNFIGSGGVINTVSKNIMTAFGSPGARTSIAIYANAIGTIAIGLSGVLKVMTPLLPYITTTYIMFKSYQTLTGIFNPIAQAIQGVTSSFMATSRAIEGATLAQRTFNAVCNTNVFAAIASAVLGIATAWTQVAEQEKYAANVAVANNNINTAIQSGIDNVSAGDYAKKNGVDLNTAKSILAVEKEYNEQIKALQDEQNAKRYTTEIYSGQWIDHIDDNYKKAIVEIGEPDKEEINILDGAKALITDPIGSISAPLEALGNLDKKEFKITFDNSRIAGSAYNKTLAETQRRVTELENQRDSQITAYKDDYVNIQKMLEEMKNIAPESDGTDDKINVGDVENVNHINDTVDIASEDLKFLRDLADQETINQFTSKLLQPQINVSFGEVRETADVDEIIKRITDGLAEDLNNSGDLVHI